MPESFTDRIINSIEDTKSLYNRLVLLVASSGAGKTAALKAVHDRTGSPLININLELTRCMLELTGRQRTLQIPRLLDEIISSHSGDTCLLDNIEILFDVSLSQDPLRLLQGLSRNKTLVVAWGGAIDEGYITYGTHDHPEFRRYPVKGILVISRENVQ